MCSKLVNSEPIALELVEKPVELLLAQEYLREQLLTKYRLCYMTDMSAFIYSDTSISFNNSLTSKVVFKKLSTIGKP